MFPFVLIPVIGMLLMYIFSIFDTHELGPPMGLKILRFRASKVLLGWTPRVFDDPLDKKVIIRIWNENFRKEYIVGADQISAWVPVIPNSKNFFAIAFASSSHEGEYSNPLEFKVPDVADVKNTSSQNFMVQQLGNSSVLLTWKKPDMSVGILTEYVIEYCQNSIGSGRNQVLRTLLPEEDEMCQKISGLKHGYHEFHLLTHNTSGVSSRCIASTTIAQHIPKTPGKPSFSWDIIGTCKPELDFAEADSSSDIIVIEECRIIEKKVLKVRWLPDLNGNPGDRFYVTYRPKNESRFLSTKVEEREMYVLLDLSNIHQVYEVFVTSLDGGFSCNSDIQEVNII